MKPNNIVILGITNSQDYFDKIIEYSYPDDLKIIFPTETTNPYLTQALQQLEITPVITKTVEELAMQLPTKILIFTTNIGLAEVMLLTDSNKDGVDVIFCKSKLNL